MSGKNILVLTGSPRVDGNSDMLADAFIDGALSNENNVVRFDTGRMNIGCCKACDTCFSTGNACTVSNGFNTIAPEIEKCDVIALVTPMYWFSITSQLKEVIDKMYSFCVAGKDITDKECFLIVCGGTEDIADFDGVISTYKLIANYLKWNDKGILVVPGVNDKGAVKETDYLSKAEALGKSI